MKNKGAALIYVMLTVGVVLGVVFFLTTIFSLKLRYAFDFPNSMTALYAADSGIEWQFYNKFKDPDAVSPSLTNGATFTILSPLGSFPVKARAVFRGVARSFEASL